MSEFGFQTASPPNGGAIVPGVTPIIGGAVGQILFQGAGNVIQESSSLFWNNAATSLNVIGTNPSVTLNSTSSLTNFSQGFGFSKNGVGIFSFGYTESVSTPRFFIYAATTDRDAIKIYNSTANVAIGNAPSQNTDAGFRLDVNGTARVQGVTSISPAGNGVSLGSASANQPSIVTSGYFSGSGAIVTSNFNGRSFNHILGGQGAGVVSTFNSNAQGITTNCEYFVARGNINLTDGAIDLSAFNFSPTIVSEVGATIKAFSSSLSAASNRWNLYLSGTAKNYIEGNTLIGTTTDDGFKLDVNGTARVQGTTSITGISSVLNVGDWTNRAVGVFVRAATGGADNRGFYIGYGASNDGNGGSLTYQATTNMLNIRSPYNNGTIALSLEGNTNSVQFHNTSGTAVSKFFSNTGNFGINTTTDAGFKFDVNGTARVQGNFNVSGGQGITTINPNTITGGTDFFVVRTASLGTFITARENGNLFLGPTAGSRAISYEALTFAYRSLSSMNFNNGGGWVPSNQLNQAGLYINASFTNAGAGATSEGSLFQFQGNTATTVGDVTLNQISMKPTYNNTGGTTINRGIFYNPTLTSLTGTTHYAFHSTSGWIRFENIPTSSAGLPTGTLYNNLGVLMIA